MSRKFVHSTKVDPPVALLSKYFSNVAAAIIFSRINFKNSADVRVKYPILTNSLITSYFVEQTRAPSNRRVRKRLKKDLIRC